jgi:hypothetical protein
MALDQAFFVQRAAQLFPRVFDSLVQGLPAHQAQAKIMEVVHGLLRTYWYRATLGQATDVWLDLHALSAGTARRPGEQDRQLRRRLRQLPDTISPRALRRITSQSIQGRVEVDDAATLCFWSLPDWRPSTAYALGDTISPGNGLAYQLTAAASSPNLSGSGAPVWGPQPGSITPDASFSWTCLGPDPTWSSPTCVGYDPLIQLQVDADTRGNVHGDADVLWSAPPSSAVHEGPGAAGSTRYPIGLGARLSSPATVSLVPRGLAAGVSYWYFASMLSQGAGSTRLLYTAGTILYILDGATPGPISLVPDVPSGRIDLQAVAGERFDRVWVAAQWPGQIAGNTVPTDTAVGAIVRIADSSAEVGAGLGRPDQPPDDGDFALGWQDGLGSAAAAANYPTYAALVPALNAARAAGVRLQLWLDPLFS